MTDLPQPTPEYELKPKLVYVGRLLGMDLYLDIHGVKNAEQKHAMVINLLRQQFHSPKEETDAKTSQKD